MTRYPPDRDTSTVREAMNDADTTIEWSVAHREKEGDKMVSALKGEMRDFEYDAEADEWTIKVELPFPVDAVLTDMDKRSRAYEVMQALADGKEVEIKDNGGENE